MISASDRDGAAPLPRRPSAAASVLTKRRCDRSPEARLTQERMTIVRNACGLDFKTTLFVCLPNANLRDFIVQYAPFDEERRAPLTICLPTPTPPHSVRPPAPSVRPPRSIRPRSPPRSSSACPALRPAARSIRLPRSSRPPHSNAR